MVLVLSLFFVLALVLVWLVVPPVLKMLLGRSARAAIVEMKRRSDPVGNRRRNRQRAAGQVEPRADPSLSRFGCTYPSRGCVYLKSP